MASILLFTFEATDICARTIAANHRSYYPSLENSIIKDRTHREQNNSLRQQDVVNFKKSKVERQRDEDPDAVSPFPRAWSLNALNIRTVASTMQAKQPLSSELWVKTSPLSVRPSDLSSRRSILKGRIPEMAKSPFFAMVADFAVLSQIQVEYL